MEPVGTITWRRRGTTQEAFEELTLLGHTMMEEIDHVQECGGCAECGTCRVRVVSGTLTPMTHEEKELLQEHPDAFAADERLGCQARPLGDCVLELPESEPEDLRFMD